MKRNGSRPARTSASATSGKLALGAALAVAGIGAAGSAHAQSASDGQLKALQAQIEQLQRQNQAQINELQRKVRELSGEQVKATADAKAAREQAAQAQAKAQAAKTEASNAFGAVTKSPGGGYFDTDGHGFFERKPGGGPLTFYVPNGELSVYGNLDVSLDVTSKNAKNNLNGAGPAGDSPVGNFGWMPAISTNVSYFGLRGFQRVADMPFNFVWQVEGGFDISATPGLKQSNSQVSDTVNGALFNRNTYIGLSSPEWGAVKVGKTSAPYANSTAAFNPFAGQIGDYDIIMGNTGGDNRYEFGGRLDHSIWYESPSIAGFQVNALFSPGQNRADNSDNIAAGESDCTGGNEPGSGGTFPIACNDGSWSNALSTNLSYTNGGFYATAAYERHFKVNRSSDISAVYGQFAPQQGGSAALTSAQMAIYNTLLNQDVADEDALKVGALYHFSTGTTVGGIFESLHRYVPADLEFQNERQRYGTWLFVSQNLNPKDSIHFGWAHAFKTPGDPGQHNDSTLVTPDGAGAYAPDNNQADMVTASWKHKFTDSLTWYSAVAATFNGPNAHYDLGAGGHGITTDCHDAFAADGGSVYGNPHCWTGTTVVGFSTGLQYRF